MKKRFLSLLLIMVLVFLLSSCSSFADVFKRKSSLTITTTKVEETYNITYHNNGHGREPREEKNVNKLPNPLPEMNETGYLFLGWSLEENSTELVEAGSSITRNTDLYGVWQEITYKIEFDVKGHGEKPNDIVGVKNLPDPLPEPVEKGYEFLGWTAKDGSNILVKAGSKISADTILYAVWNRGVFNITFDSNGHGEAPGAKTSVTRIPKLPQMSDTGYRFLGWSLKSDSTELVEVGSEVLENITLYAVWEEITYKISFDTNGHGENPEDIENVKLIPENLPELYEPGFSFLGWSSSKSTTKLVTPGSEIYRDTTLYAAWKDETHKVTFHTKGYGEEPEPLEGVYKLPLDLPVLEDEDYDFVGWSLSEDSEEVIKIELEIFEDTDLYAVWKEKIYKVTFDSNGHGVAPQAKSDVKTLPDPLPTMAIDGYLFKGWSLSPKSTELVEAGTPLSSDVTLYAVWEEITYDITYDANGYGEAPNKTIGTSSIPNPLPTMTAEGYTFKGWSKSRYSTKKVMPGEMITSDITLYAIWVKNTYRITYYNNGRGTAPEDTVGTTAFPNPLPTMTADDYEFKGWSIFSKRDEQIPVQAGDVIDSNVELYAIWDQKTYTITYNANGHGTAPSSTVGAIKLPEVLPTIDDDNYDFLGWSLASDSTTMVDAGKRIHKDTELFAVWVKKAATIKAVKLKKDTPLTNYAANDLDDLRNTYHALNKIVYVVEYDDVDEPDVEVTVDKTMISDADYLALQTPGEHTITINILGQPQELTITTINYWDIAYYVRGNLIQKYPFPDGSNSNTPSRPKDYLDENNILWTFDRWSESNENVHKHMDITAIFKEVDLFAYNVIVNSTDKATISISYDTRVTGYSLEVRDTKTNALIKTYDINTTEFDLSDLVTSTSYKISGTYTFEFDNSSYTLDIDEAVFTTKLVEDIESVEYVVDERSISSKALNLDVSSYAQAAPEGYELSKVFLVDVTTEEIKGVFEYTNDNTVAYFNNLNASTEYETIFLYSKIKNSLLSYREFDHEYKINPEYGFYFRGFRVYTSYDDENIKEVQIVYKDPSRGEKVLYRYYVSSGNDVPYSTFEYRNPFTFRLPIIYRDYRAFGDYSELRNVTEDKKVYVYLIKEYYDTPEATHKIVYVGYTNSTKYENEQYIISVENVADGASTNPPVDGVDFNAYLPAETDDYRYEVSWEPEMYYASIDLTNVKYSAILYAKYKAVAKNPVTTLGKPYLTKPDSKTYSRLLSVGSDYVISVFYIHNYSALVHLDSNNNYVHNTSSNRNEGVDMYLIKGSLNATGEKINYSNYITKSDLFIYSNLTPDEYVFHVEFKYDTLDGTGVHTAHYAIPFTVGCSTLNPNLTFTSPNYQEIKVNNPDYGSKGVFLIPYNFLYNNTFETYYISNSKATEVAEYEHLQTNSQYKIYSYDYEPNLCVYKKIDAEERAFRSEDCEITNGFTNRISDTYYTTKTIDGVKPTQLILELPRDEKYWSNGSYSYSSIQSQYFVLEDLVRIKIGNYTKQIDIGKIQIEMYAHSNEFNSNTSQANIQFAFDAEKEYYVPEYSNVFGEYFSMFSYRDFYQAYQTFFGMNYGMNYHCELVFRYFYNTEIYSDYISIDDLHGKSMTPQANKCYITFYKYENPYSLKINGSNTSYFDTLKNDGEHLYIFKTHIQANDTIGVTKDGVDVSFSVGKDQALVSSHQVSTHKYIYVYVCKDDSIYIEVKDS